jgi:hypothetical protein
VRRAGTDPVHSGYIAGKLPPDQFSLAARCRLAPERQQRDVRFTASRTRVLEFADLSGTASTALRRCSDDRDSDDGGLPE